MDISTFDRTLQITLSPGMVLQNPGGGISTVISVKNGKVRYKRGRSTYSVAVEALFAAYSSFKGRRVSSSDLKRFAPAIFDSAARPAGHSCNCTFLFLTLKEMQLISGIKGEGLAGRPFFAEILTQT